MEEGMIQEYMKWIQKEQEEIRKLQADDFYTEGRLRELRRVEYEFRKIFCLTEEDAEG